VDAFESVYIRLGTISLSRKWLEKDVSAWLTTLVMIGLVLLGSFAGFLAGWIAGARRVVLVI